MPTTTLHHCVPVTIVSYVTPTLVVLDLTVGGSPGDGVVDVTTVPPVLPWPMTFPSGGTSSTPLVPVLSVTLHYRQADPSKPPFVEVDHTP